MRSSKPSRSCGKSLERFLFLPRSSDYSTKPASKTKKRREETRRKKASRLDQRFLPMARMPPKLHIQAPPPLGWRQLKRLASLRYGVIFVFWLYVASSCESSLALLLGGDFFTGAVLAAALTKLVLRFANLSPDKKANSLRAEAMLIMTSTIRVGQSKFSSAPIDEDSNERIMNCIQTLSELEIKPVVQSIFLSDTKAAYSKMVAAQEVCMC
jgi:hypothetical protein